MFADSSRGMSVRVLVAQLLADLEHHLAAALFASLRGPGEELLFRLDIRDKVVGSVNMHLILPMHYIHGIPSFSTSDSIKLIVFIHLPLAPPTAESLEPGRQGACAPTKLT